MNTPITNDAAWEYGRGHFVVGVDLARQLERDRSRLLEALKLCQSSLQKLSFADDETTKARNAAYRVLASLEIKE